MAQRSLGTSASFKDASYVCPLAAQHPSTHDRPELSICLSPRTERTTLPLLLEGTHASLVEIAKYGQRVPERGRTSTDRCRCDSLRPACTACLKSARAHGEEEGSIRCSYDEADSRGEKRKRGAGSAGQIASLSSRIGPFVSSSETLLTRRSGARGAT